VTSVILASTRSPHEIATRDRQVSGAIANRRSHVASALRARPLPSRELHYDPLPNAPPGSLSSAVGSARRRQTRAQGRRRKAQGKFNVWVHFGAEDECMTTAIVRFPLPQRQGPMGSEGKWFPGGLQGKGFRAALCRCALNACSAGGIGLCDRRDPAVGARCRGGTLVIGGAKVPVWARWVARGRGPTRLARVDRMRS
jgi:hypothetical protein